MHKINFNWIEYTVAELHVLDYCRIYLFFHFNMLQKATWETF